MTTLEQITKTFRKLEELRLYHESEEKALSNKLKKLSNEVFEPLTLELQKYGWKYDPIGTHTAAIEYYRSNGSAKFFIYNKEIMNIGADTTTEKLIQEFLDKM